MLSGAPEILERYFDYEAFGRDLFLKAILKSTDLSLLIDKHSKL